MATREKDDDSSFTQKREKLLAWGFRLDVGRLRCGEEPEIEQIKKIE